MTEEQEKIKEFGNEQLRQLIAGAYDSTSVHNRTTLAICVMLTTKPSDIEGLYRLINAVKGERVYVILNRRNDETEIGLSPLVRAINKKENVFVMQGENNPLDFSAMKNRFLEIEHVKSDWILFLDADEYVDINDLNLLKKHIKDAEKHNISALQLINMEVTTKNEIQSVEQLRCVKKSEGWRWCFQIHEQILKVDQFNTSIVARTQAIIRHKGYSHLNDSELFEKYERNLTTLVNALDRLFQSKANGAELNVDEVIHYSKYLEVTGREFTAILENNTK